MNNTKIVFKIYENGNDIQKLYKTNLKVKMHIDALSLIFRFYYKLEYDLNKRLVYINIFDMEERDVN